MNRRVNVIGVGMTPFTEPGAGDRHYALAAEAGRLALLDAGIELRRVEAAYAGFGYGDSLCGQRAIAQLGQTAIPIINISNHDSSGSSALYLARQAIEYGAAECVLAMGSESRLPEPAWQHWQARELLLASAGGEYMRRYGTRKETFAMIAVKSREHGARNAHAMYRQLLSLEAVLAAQDFAPLTRLQYCLPASGAAAVLLCSDDFARKHRLSHSVYIAAQSMTTDLPDADGKTSAIRATGYDLSVAAAREVYERAGIGPEEVNVCELHDCSSASEILLYEALGFCREGDAEKLVEDGDNTYGGNRVVNPSGGLLSMGHPLGATGLAQCAELVWQLRATAAQRQVSEARIALQHNMSIGGACVVTMYRRD